MKFKIKIPYRKVSYVFPNILWYIRKEKITNFYVQILNNNLINNNFDMNIEQLKKEVGNIKGMYTEHIFKTGRELSRNGLNITKYDYFSEISGLNKRILIRFSQTIEDLYKANVKDLIKLYRKSGERINNHSDILFLIHGYQIIRKYGIFKLAKELYKDTLNKDIPKQSLKSKTSDLNLVVLNDGNKYLIPSGLKLEILGDTNEANLCREEYTKLRDVIIGQVTSDINTSTGAIYTSKWSHITNELSNFDRNFKKRIIAYGFNTVIATQLSMTAADYRDMEIDKFKKLISE